MRVNFEEVPFNVHYSKKRRIIHCHAGGCFLMLLHSRGWWAGPLSCGLGLPEGGNDTSC